MKKNKILLIVLVVGIIVLGIVIFIKSQAVTETKRLGNGENTNHNETSSSSKPSIQFPLKKFYQFVANNFQIPIDLKGNGKIYIKFIVEIDGSITNEEILKDVGFGTGEEAIRVIKLSPKWIPAKKDGVPIRVQYSLPITLQQG